MCREFPPQGGGERTLQMERGLHRLQASLLSDLWQGYQRHMDPILPPACWPGEDTPPHPFPSDTPDRARLWETACRQGGG